jgi:hypothetical protein
MGIGVGHYSDSQSDRRDRAEIKGMNTTLMVKACYCGIDVEIICEMNHCSLVCFNERFFVVDTADLVLQQSFKETATGANNAWAALHA